MKQIIEANCALFKRARTLNTRAGREVFPIPSREQLAETLLQVLGGVARIADISNMDAIRLPPLDESTVAKIIDLCPDAIVVCGREVKVEYRSVYPPRVQIDFRDEYARGWLDLPDAGIHLPDGREVTLYSAVEGHSYYIEAMSSQFKVKTRECLNQKLWDAWSKPNLPAPDVSNPEAKLPDIVTAEYGRCGVPGEPLLAYGIVTCDCYCNLANEWFRNRAEAEKSHASALSNFAEVRGKARCEALRKRIGELHAKYQSGTDFSADIRTALAQVSYGYNGCARTATELEQLIARAETEEKAIITRAEALGQEVASGVAMEDFSAWHRRGGMTNNGEGWVIRPDGTFRGHDSDDVRRHKSDGTYLWKVVRADELALRWQCNHVGDVDGNSEFEVIKLPVNGCTPAQLTAVRQIEEEIGASEGAFGLDMEARKQRDDIFALVRAKITKCPGTNEVLNWDEDALKRLLGSNGNSVAQGDKVAGLLSGREFSDTCDGREAQVVKTWVLSSEDIVEGLAYHKFGDWNLSLRYRKARPAEFVEEKVETPPQQTGGVPSADKLAALRDKFKK